MPEESRPGEEKTQSICISADLCVYLSACRKWPESIRRFSSKAKKERSPFERSYASG
jgi:hypothetical protein